MSDKSPGGWYGLGNPNSYSPGPRAWSITVGSSSLLLVDRIQREEKKKRRAEEEGVKNAQEEKSKFYEKGMMMEEQELEGNVKKIGGRGEEKGPGRVYPEEKTGMVVGGKKKTREHSKRG